VSAASRWIRTYSVALLCACGMGPQSEQTLRTFARGVHSAGRGYSGSLRRTDAVSLQDLGICRDDIDRVRTGFASGPMVIGGAPLLGVTRGDVQNALDGDHGFSTRPTVWHPCGTNEDAPGSGGERPIPARTPMVAGQIRLGTLRIEFTADRGNLIRVRLVGPNVTNCTQLAINTRASSLDVTLNGSPTRPSVRSATVGMDALDRLDHALQIDVCGTTYDLDSAQREALRSLVERRRQLIAPDTAFHGTLRDDVLYAMERLFHALENVGPLTGVKSLVVTRSATTSTELWRANGTTGPVYFWVTLLTNPRGGTEVGIGPATPHEPKVLNLGRAALAAHDYERAAWILGLPDDRGDGETQLALGVLLMRGGEIARSPEQAAALFLSAAEQRNVKAEFNLALLYDQGDGVERNQEQALSWARRAADHGNAQAQSFVGSFYALGEVVPKDWALAESWYRKAAEQGDAEGCRRLGVMYSLGQGVTKDDAAAFEWFRKSADSGWPAGLVALGRAHEDGLGTPRDYRAARDCYQRAHQAGHLEGAFRLGLLMLDGRGGPTDEARARELISQAAAGGLEEARAFVAAQTPP